MKKIAFITGATSGIGKATAYALASHFNLILCGRRQERLEKIQNELKEKTKVFTLSFDVRDKDVVFKKIQSLPEEWKNIDILINNAGNAYGLSPIHEGDIQDWDNMIDINVKGLLYVSKAILPNMIQRKTGHIINICSIAGQEVYPKGNVYCASKYAVDAITKGMRQDLNPYNIKVTSISPGLVETEFSIVRFHGDQQKADNVYKGYQPLTGKDIAEIIEFVVTRPPHVVLADVLILPVAQANSTMVHKHLS